MPVPGPDQILRAASLVDLLEQQAERQPERTALTFTGGPGAPAGTLTFAEIVQAARRIAVALAERYPPGERALLLLPTGLDYVAGLLGCLHAGIVAVPVNLPGPARVARVLGKLDPIVRDCQPRVVLATSEIVAASGAVLEEALIRGHGCGVLPLDELDHDPARWRRPALDHGTIAFLQYTSGSTGAPKGVVNRHSGLLHNNLLMARLTRLHEGSVMASWLPLYHDMGLIGGILHPLSHGVPTVFMAPGAFAGDPLGWLDLATAHRATLLPGSASGFQACLDRAEPERLAALDLSAVEAAMPAAEPVLPRLVEGLIRTFGPCGLRPAAIKPCYGLAEATLMVSACTADGPPPVRIFDTAAIEQGRLAAAADPAKGRGYVGNGAEFGGQTLRIVDPETRRPLPAGSIGEIWVAGPALADGYWNQPEATAATFAARLAVPADAPGAALPYLRTGDLGALADGHLFITGRLKDMLLFHGRCHYPNDIEATAAAADPACAEGGAAFSVELDGIEHLVLVQEVGRRRGAAVDWDGLMTRLRLAIGREHGLPVHEIVLIRKGTLLRTTSGKVRRKAMRAAWQADRLTVLARRRFASAPAAADAEPIERPDAIAALIAGEVARALGGLAPDAIDRSAGFFDLGLDSLALAALAATLGRQLGVRLDEHVLFANPTIAELAAHLAARRPPVRDRRPALAGGAAPDEPIAVVGIGLRMPDAEGAAATSAADFWAMLIAGRSAIRPAPAERCGRALDIPGFGSFLPAIDRFDTAFFGISPREAIATDPQQRLLLEVAWHALEDAGIPPDRLRHADGGVFIGVSALDYGCRPFLGGDPAGFDAYYATGNSAAAASGRLAYVLGLDGPAVTIDTACSSSLVAVHYACQSLRLGECDLALAGGVKLHLLPEVELALTRAGMMAPDGRCKTFDARADGYVRGEGVGVLVLKRLADAQADGDRIRAVLRASAVRQDGVRAGLTVPNGAAQQRLIAATLERAGLAPAAIDYVEAHGTGTRLGDAIEHRALVDVFAPDRPDGRPLWLGSVKTNLGHLEGAAGIAGLIKAVLAVEQGVLPPHLNLDTVNPAIELDAVPCRVPAAAEFWPVAPGRPRRAGVSSFGFTGTIAHAVVEEAPPAPPQPAAAPLPSHLLLLSARSAGALAELAAAWRTVLTDETIPPGPLLAAAARSRAHHPRRRAVVAADRAGLIAALGKAAPARPATAGTPRIAFLFSGQGAQQGGMAQALHRHQPAFRAALDEALAALAPHLAADLPAIMFAPADPRLDATEFAQPALFAVGYALARMWQDLGVRPVFVAGHSIGELAAAAAIGALPLAGTARFVARRGQLMQALEAPGAMAAVRASADAIVPLLEAHAGRLDLAAVNGPEDVTIAGEAAALDELLARLAADGIGARRLPVSHAFHSPLMDPVLDALAEAAAGIEAAEPALPFFSTVLGRLSGAAELGDPAYWRRHARATVRFAEAVPAALAAGATHLLEIGPAGHLSALARRALPDDRTDVACIASLRRGVADLAAFHQAAGALYEAGQVFDWSALAPGPRAAPERLPLYPFERQSYWQEVAPRPATAASDQAPAPDADAVPAYAVEWIEATLPAPADIPSRWLLVADDAGLAAALAERLPGTAKIAAVDALDAAPERLAAADQVLFLRGLDLADETADDDQPLLDLVALAQQARGRSISLLIVSRGAQRTGGEHAGLSAAQASLWGAGRALAIEAPALRLQLLDLDPDADPLDQLATFCPRLPALAPDQDLLALRAGHAFSPRLTPQALPAAPPPALDSTGLYLVAGGAGALGQAVSGWLATAGARHLLWLGRSAPDERAAATMAALRGQGVAVAVEPVDIADAAAMAELSARLDATARAGAPALRGIVHCAGALGLDPLETLTPAAMRRVLAAKTLGSWHLHRLSEGRQLDLFLLFTSIAGIWGSKLQTAYAAANAWQDGLARRRAAAGLPALAVAWGPWAGDGMAAGHADLVGQLRRAGIRPASPERCLAALPGLLQAAGATGRPDWVAADVAWADFLPLQALLAGTPFFERCGTPPAPAAAQAPAPETAADAAAILALPAAERMPALTAFLRRLIAATLRLPPDQLAADSDLLALGLDSILAMDVARSLDAAFGIACQLRQFFETPTPAALAGHVAALIAARGIEGAPAALAFRLRPDLDRRHEPFPLTELQHAYWAGRSASFSLGNVACHGYLETEADGLDVALLERCWNALIARHDCLRLVVDRDGRQRILPAVPACRITVADLGTADNAAVAAHLDAWRAELSHKVLPAETWPLFELRASRLPGGRVRLHLSIDMLINDAASSGILWAELAALYRAGGDAAAAGLAPFEISFRDVVLARDDPASGLPARREQAEAYWRARLDRLPPGPQLPLAADPERIEAPRFVRHGRDMPAAQWQQLKARAAAHGLTPAALLLAAFAEVLAAWSAEPAFSINLTLFERPDWHPDIARMVGDFTAVSLLAIDRTAPACFVEAARGLQRTMVADLEHRAFSGVDVLRLLSRQGGGQRRLMPVVFTSQLGLAGPELHGADTPLGDPVFGITQTPQVWLDHQVTERAGGLHYDWDVVEALFPDGLVAAMVEAYAALLERLAADEAAWTAPVGALLPPAQQAVRARVNATAGPVPDQLLHEPFEASAAAAPQAIALRAADGRAWSYGALDRWRARLAQALAAAGAEAGTPVAVLMEKGPEQVAACLAVLSAGGVYVPLDPAWPDERLATILARGGIALALVQPWRAAELAARLPDLHLLDASEAALAGRPAILLAPDRAPDDPAYIIYTSGSTGTPKGVVIDHRAALNTVLDVNRRFGVAAADVALGVSALTFDLSVWDIFGTLAAGGCLVLPDEADRRDPAHWAALCRTHGVTVWNSVPALLDLLLEEDDPAALASLRAVFLSGDWVPLGLPARLRARAPRARLIAMGGATEASIWSNWWEVEDVPPHWTSIPYGYPLANQGYRVLDGLGRDRPDWVPGDLCITGLGLAQGYAGAPELTAAAFVHDPATGERLYRTGDLARYWPDGVLEFLGRRDRQVKIAGHRIELGEIEAALAAHPAIKDAVADAIGAERQPRRLVAWWVPEKDAAADFLELTEVDQAAAAAEHRACLDAAGAALHRLAPEDSPVRIGAQWPLLAEIAAQAVRDSLAAAGLFARPGARHDRAAIAQMLGLDEAFAGLLRQWLDLLTETGDLERDGTALLAPDGLRHADWLALAARAAGFGLPAAALAKLQAGAEDRLAVLRGALDPLALFYGADDALAPERLAQSNPLAEAALGAVRAALAALAEPGRPLRVLEIGARGGLAARALLADLPAGAIDYILADTSRAFLDQARAALADLGDDRPVRFALYDPDAALPRQALPAAGFDLVLAVNALHRCRDIPRQLAALAGLLRPGGHLLAPEMTRNSALQLVTVALIERGYDGLLDLRRHRHQPLLSGAAWTELLQDAGFGRAAALAPTPELGRACGLHLLVAQGPLRQRVARPERLRAYLATRLPAYMVPSQLVCLGQLPLSANGKVDRDRLPQPVAPAAASSPSAPPATPGEQAIARLMAALLGIEAIGRDDDFFALGGDSLIAVRLVERIRAELGRALAVRDLFEAPTLRGLAERAERAGAAAPAERIAFTPDPAAAFQPFPLTEVQQAYWIGRQGLFTLGQVATYLYTEIEVEDVPAERLAWAWQALIRRHDMLRAVLDEDGRQRVLAEVPPYAMPVRDLRGRPAAEAEALLAAWRAEMAQQVLPAERWPLFDVRAAILPDGGVRLFVGIDNIICDGASMHLLYREWSQLARGGEPALAALPPLGATFRDYVLALARQEDSAAYARSLEFWLARIDRLPPAPALPLVANPATLERPRFARRQARLAPSAWAALKVAAQRHGITANALLLTAYGETLAAWTAEPAFTLTLTVFHRPPLHADIDRLVGDFTSLVLLPFDGAGALSFLERARALQQELALGLEHLQVSAVRVLREAARRAERLQADGFPVVFTSALRLDAPAADAAPLGRFGWGLTQTPQVWLDHQVTEQGGGLDYNWDAVEALFPDGLLDAMIGAYGGLLGRLATEPAAWTLPAPALLPARPAHRALPVPPAAPAAAANGAAVQPPAPPADRAIALAVAEAFQEVLGLPGPPDGQSFFELGANSLALIRIRRRLQTRLGLSFPVVEMFAHPSVDALARRLAALAGNGAPPPAPDPMPAPPERSARPRAAGERRRAAKRAARGQAELLP
jgi:amino acid adenylation domain-containing protein